jgi:hypothetical protein
MEKFLQPNFQLLQYCVRQKERTNILKKRTKKEKRQIHKEEQSKRNVKIRRLREQKVSQKKQKRI